MAWIIFVVLIIGLLYIISTYNGLVEVKNGVSKAWANIDVLLKQRHDELPKLIDTCKQHMQYEQATLEKVIAARSRVSSARESQNLPALGQAEGALRSSVGQLFALSENYPELKASEQFVQLQARITALESGIADRREFYNESVNINNVRIAQFPGVLVARFFNFKDFSLLTFSTEETQDVDIGARFQG